MSAFSVIPSYVQIRKVKHEFLTRECQGADYIHVIMDKYYHFRLIISVIYVLQLRLRRQINPTFVREYALSNF